MTRDLIDFNLAAANAGGAGIARWPTVKAAAAGAASRSLARLAKPVEEIRLIPQSVVQLAGINLRRHFLEIAQREALRAMAGAVERLALVWLTWPDAKRLATMTSRELDTLARHGDQVLEFVGPAGIDDTPEHSYRNGLWCPDFYPLPPVEAKPPVRGAERLHAIALAEKLILHGASTRETGHFTGLNEKVIRELIRDIRGKCKRGAVQYPAARTLVGNVRKQDPRLIARSTLFATILHQLQALQPGLQVGELFMGALRLAETESQHLGWSWSDDDVHRCFQAYRLLNAGELVLERCGCGCMQLQLGWHEWDKPCLACRRATHVANLRTFAHLGGRRRTEDVRLSAS